MHDAKLFFHGSAVTDVTPFTVTETGETLPLSIFPCLLGSRVLSFGLDATGQQGLDGRTCEYPTYQSQYGGHLSLYDDLYIYHSAMKSTHTTGDTMLRMPLGWLSYVLIIDGVAYDTAAIQASATEWQRHFSLTDVAMRVSYMLAGVAVEVLAYVPDHSVQPVFTWRIRSADAKAHTVHIQGTLHLTLRAGEPLFTVPAGAWQMDDAMGFSLDIVSDDTVQVLEPYHITLGIAGGTPSSSANALMATHTLAVPATGTVSATITYYFGSNQTDTDGDARCRAALASPLSFDAHIARTAEYWKARATISTGDVRRDYVYHASIYLTELGTDMRFGAGCSGNWVPQHLSDAIFWDSHYMVDGLLHCGGLAHTEDMVRWQTRTMGKDGKRPFYWMCHYTGEPLCDDTGYTSIAGHVMTAVRVGMFTQDPEILQQCNAIIQYGAQYAVEHFFEKTAQGWILSAPSTTDITFSAEFTEGAKNNTYTHLWFLSNLDKALAFAERLGYDAPHLATCREILRQYYLEQNATEYLDQKDGHGGERWDSYIPILCYPTEGQHWIDARKYIMTRILHEHYCCNMAVSHFKMPWPMCWGAASDMRMGLNDAAEHRLTSALWYVYGLGYFAEGASEGYIGATQPYLSTHGAYLTAQSEQFFRTDFFERKIYLFAHLGRMQELAKLSFARLHGAYGVVGTAQYTPGNLTATITGGDGATFDIEVVVPYMLRGEQLDVRVNDMPVPFEQPLVYEDYIDTEGEWRTGIRAQKTVLLRDVALQGTTTITVRRTTTVCAPDDVLIYNFLNFGAEFGGMLRASGMSVCSTAHLREFQRLLAGTSHAIYADGVSALTPNQVGAFETYIRAGGNLVLFFEMGLQHYASALVGLQMHHRDGNRWNLLPLEVTMTRTAEASEELPACVHYHELSPLDGTAHDDVTVLYRDAQGNPCCTLRHIGAGTVLWIAAGRPYQSRRPFLESAAWRSWFTALIRWWAAATTPTAVK